jgi:uncharacterized protein YkwD
MLQSDPHLGHPGREVQVMRAQILLGVMLTGAACGGTDGTDTTPLRASTAGAGAAGNVATAAAGSASPAIGKAGSPATAAAATGTPPAAAGSRAMPPQLQAGALAGVAGIASLPTAAGSGAPAAPAVGGAPPPKSLADCPAAPADAPPAAVAALNTVNNLRVAAGAGCATLNMQIVQAATAHCMYYQMNNSANPMCTANPHMEVMGCAGFTGQSPIDRMKTAGFTANGGGEVMAFVNSPERSVQTWVDSVWHRIPILDPTTSMLGYGSTGSPGNCDTIDFGPGNRAAANTVLVYPYDGQINVTTTFDGSREGPMPPAPPTGWPSANPITLYASKPVITEHVLTVDGSTEPIEHVWLDSNATILSASDKNFLRASVFMYANKPYMPNTKYRVRMSGTYTGGMLMKEWTFTTGAAPTRR